MIFIKKSKLVIDAFTYNQNAYKLFPIDHAIKYLPDWWKQTPKEYKNNGLPVSTIKRCTGVQNLFTQGLILPMWTDLAIQLQENGANFEFADKHTTLTPHDNRQWNTFADPKKFMHFKVMAPWSLHSKSDVNWLYSHPTFHLGLDVPYNVVPASIEFKYQHGVHVNMMMPIKLTEHIIKAGTAAAHLIPISEKEIEIKHHFISSEEFDRKYSEHMSHSFIRGYQKTKQILKGKECPFKF